ncbi:hypothetical protein KM043_014421 [Ampulex compressa]|nr:hypothetical protein KM043_014421 [Ampulex compressa]
MDNTLDSIRPSTAITEDMSYLFGRDPSILAYGQRPCPSDATKKNLLSSYEVEEPIHENESLETDSQCLQTVKVYLRMKPFPKKLKLSQEQREAYSITNSTTLSTNLPAIGDTINSMKRKTNEDTICRKFTFTKTFGAETTQLELFDQAIKQSMIDFLSGQNCTVMTYGTTNSGKSYTLQGTTTSPGILPRALEFVFSNITPKAIPSYKPVHHRDIIGLDALERAQEIEIKTQLLTFGSMDRHHHANAYKQMQKVLQEESPIRPSHGGDAHYSIWVSFAEIYNETIYDLLSNESQKKRIPLKLATDNYGTPFIKGLKTICVNSASEAYQVLMAGQYNLKVAATALNAKSSRSHCIFIIKLLKYYVENMPNSVELSMFAFCDLAGSERLKKTLNIGDRLKEAQNINTSLLVLGRCLKSIHEGQFSKQRTDPVGPFRESKLTRLFQRALSGKEHIALIVNVNPIPNLYIETQNVLNFSAIAKKIVIEQKKKSQCKAKSRFSQLVTQSIKTVTDWDVTEVQSIELQETQSERNVLPFIHPEDYEDLTQENEKLKIEIRDLKNSALARDLQIRQEMADTYMAMMKELETDWKNRVRDVEEQKEDAVEWSVKQIEDYYQKKLDKINARKRKRTSQSADSENEDSRHDEFEIENAHLMSKISFLKNRVKELREINQNLNIEKNKAKFELSLAHKDLNSVQNLLTAAQQDGTDSDMKYYIEELNSQLTNKQEQVKMLKQFLNEAKEEYITITTDARNKEAQLKEQREIILENEERIEELEAHVQHANLCLAEKDKAVETLENSLERQSEKILNAKFQEQCMQNEITKLKNEKEALLQKIDALENAKLIKNVIPRDIKSRSEILDKLENSFKIDEYDEIIIKEEFINDSETGLPSDIKEIVHNEIGRAMLEKITSVQKENATLKERLSQSTNEIQSLGEELKSAKLKLNDISIQIQHLNRNNSKVNRSNIEIACSDISNDNTLIKARDEACNVDNQEEEAKLNISNNNAQTFDNKESQTITRSSKDEVSQTSFIEENPDEELLEQWAKLLVERDDIKVQYKKKSLRVTELMDEQASLQEKIKNMTEQSVSNSIVLKEYKCLLKSLEEELFLLKEKEKNMGKLLEDRNRIHNDLESKVATYEQRISNIEKELSSVHEENKNYVEEMKKAQESLDTQASKYKHEKEQVILELEDALSIEKQNNEIKAQCLNTQEKRLKSLENEVESITKLKEEINELNKNLEKCQTEKDILQKLLDQNNEKLTQLKSDLQVKNEKEQEKDQEILTLQREMKRMIQQSENDEQSGNAMEREMKNTIRDLTETKEVLSEKEKLISVLEMRLSSFQQNAKLLELLQQSAQERQTENEKLRIINDELKNALTEKEREMEAFLKNRDETVTKYEALVSHQQEDLDRQKREVMRFQELFLRQTTLTPNKEECKKLQSHIEDLQERLRKYESHSKEKHCEQTLKDEAIPNERQVGRRRKKNSPSPKQSEIPVIDLSTSNTKHSTKHTDLPPPYTDTSTDRKRGMRKKKLFSTDESFQDIEPIENTVAVTPSSVSRKLRTRRKQV